MTNEQDNTVNKLRASDGVNLGTFAVGEAPEGIAFDGTNIWVANYFGKSATKLLASDGTVSWTFEVVNLPYGIAYDGTNIWVASFQDNTVTKLRTGDGMVLGTFPVGGSQPTGVTLTGRSIRVVNYTSNNDET